MKKITLLFLLTFITLCSGQTPQKLKTQSFKITQTECIKKKGFRLQLKSVIDDSRCPEGVDCIWAGEVKIVVMVYKDRKFLNETTMTVSSKQLAENTAWFSKYVPSGKKNIKNISVFPYPKEGNPIDPKAYYIKIDYLK